LSRADDRLSSATVTALDSPSSEGRSSERPWRADALSDRAYNGVPRVLADC